MKPLTLQFYKHPVTRRWRWRVTHSNGNKLGQSSQGLGYSQLFDAERSAGQVLAGNPDAVLNDRVVGRDDVEVGWS